MAAVDGLVSGLNTADIIGQLMQLERQPQNRLRTQSNVAQRTIDAYRGVNALFLQVKTAAEALTSGTAWSLSKVTSSAPTSVTSAAAAGAAAGRLTFTVDRLAAGGVSASAGTVTGTSTVVATPGSTIRLTKGASSTTVPVGDGTLSGVVKAINAAGAGVTATAVEVSPGQHKLQLSSTTTGATTSLSLDDGSGGNPFAASTLGAVQQVAAGQDALLQVGGAGGYTVTRASNTISDLMPGVTLTLTKADPLAPVTVEVAADPAATADAVSKLVDAVNAALADIRKHTAYDAATKRSALLTGDGLLRGLQQRLAGAASTGGVAGVSVTREGTLTFDRTRFLAQLERDPVATRSALGGTTAAPGVAERLRAVADQATRSAAAAGGAGLLTSAIKSHEDEIRGLSSSIASWDARLTLREAKLKKQFGALEVALGKTQQQGQWLAGQIAGLPRMGA
jgi:flagellar hook-associated protein 2